MFRKTIKTAGALILSAFVWGNLALMAMADDTPNIGQGINTIDPATAAGNIKNVFLSISGLAGVVGLGALVWAGFRMMTAHTDRGRAETKEHLVDIFKGLGLVGGASLLIGLACFVIQKAYGG